MGDTNRFFEFAKVIRKHFPQVKEIADIAGGKGGLQAELKKFGYKVTTYDKRSKKQQIKGTVFKSRFFDDRVREKFDLLVAMHPDEATDLVIYEATKRKVPFAVVPCCVLPNKYAFPLANKKGVSRKFPFKQIKKMNVYHEWIEHLRRTAEKEGFEVIVGKLPIKNKNIMLIGKRK